MLLGRGWRRAQDRKVCSCTDTLSLYAARSSFKFSGLRCRSESEGLAGRKGLSGDIHTV